MVVKSKICCLCKTEKPLEDFYRKKERRDGRQAYCKSCNNKKAVSYYQSHKSDPRWLLKHRTKCRFSLQEARKHGRVKPKTKQQQKQISKNQRTKFPEKIKARSVVLNALRSGSLVRGKCEVCGTSKRVHAHHWSYLPEHWYNVQWLCHTHHMEAHRKMRENELILSASSSSGQENSNKNLAEHLRVNEHSPS